MVEHGYLSYVYNPYDVKQIEDKEIYFKIKDNYLIIETIFYKNILNIIFFLFFH